MPSAYIRPLRAGAGAHVREGMRMNRMQARIYRAFEQRLHTLHTQDCTRTTEETDERRLTYV